MPSDYPSLFRPSSNISTVSQTNVQARKTCRWYSSTFRQRWPMIPSPSWQRWVTFNSKT